MKAYTVTDNDDEDSVLVFARDHNHARRLGVGSLSSGDYIETRARRLPDADHLIPKGCRGLVVSDPRTQHEAGFWIGCYSCGHRVTADGCEDCIEGSDDAEPESPVYHGGDTYCSAACVGSEIQRVEAEAWRVEGVKATLLDKFPGATIKHIDYQGNGVAFDFPGSKVGARYTLGESSALVAPCDMEAWMKFTGKPWDLVPCEVSK